MINNSQDLLTIIKAVSLLGFVFFVCWGLYYFAMILRQGYLIIKEMRDRIHMVDETIKAFKEKIEHSTSYLLLISEGVKQLVKVIKKYSDKSDNKKRSSKKD
ncbi:MAG: hypothetical protein Q7T50_07270 [Candidatus Magasanikbacteria bacterium]|nr:hypothetical protein [Candidatus Magasanikbacteria bacterium]